MIPGFQFRVRALAASGEFTNILFDDIAVEANEVFEIDWPGYVAHIGECFVCGDPGGGHRTTGDFFG